MGHAGMHPPLIFDRLPPLLPMLLVLHLPAQPGSCWAMCWRRITQSVPPQATRPSQPAAALPGRQARMMQHPLWRGRRRPGGGAWRRCARRVGRMPRRCTCTPPSRGPGWMPALLTITRRRWAGGSGQWVVKGVELRAQRERFTARQRRAAQGLMLASCPVPHRPPHRASLFCCSCCAPTLRWPRARPPLASGSWWRLRSGRCVAACGWRPPRPSCGPPLARWRQRYVGPADALRRVPRMPAH